MHECKYGCPQKFKEDLNNHIYMYHEMKTMSLMCGCGYGDIFVGRFRKHLYEAHGECRTHDECVQQFFLAPVTSVSSCKEVYGAKV